MRSNSFVGGPTWHGGLLVSPGAAAPEAVLGVPVALLVNAFTI
jgi:hypothetical protein